MGRHCTRLHRPERGQLPSRTLQHRHVLAQPLTRGRTEHQADCRYRLPIYSTPRNTMRHLANYPGRNRYGSTQPVGKGCTATQRRRAQRFTLQQSLDSRSRASHGKSSSSSKGRDQIPHHRLLRLSGIGYGDHWEVESSCDCAQTLRALRRRTPRSAAGAAEQTEYSERLTAAPVCCSGWFGEITARRHATSNRRGPARTPAGYQTRVRWCARSTAGQAVRSTNVSSHQNRLDQEGQPEQCSDHREVLDLLLFGEACGGRPTPTRGRGGLRHPPSASGCRGGHSCTTHGGGTATVSATNRRSPPASTAPSAIRRLLRRRTQDRQPGPQKPENSKKP